MQCLVDVLLDDNSTLQLTKHFTAMHNLRAGEEAPASEAIRSTEQSEVARRRARRRRRGRTASASDATWEAMEEQRRSVPPYLVPGQILSILRFRADYEGDADARDFLKQNRGRGFFQRLFS